MILFSPPPSYLYKKILKFSCYPSNFLSDIRFTIKNLLKIPKKETIYYENWTINDTIQDKSSKKT